MDAPSLPRLRLGQLEQLGRSSAPGATSEAAPRPRARLVPNAELSGREEIAPNVARLFVRPDGPVPAFQPGQYFSLGLTFDARAVLRPYSTASRKGAVDTLEFLVRRVPSGTFTPRLWQLAVGERLWIGPPKGLFTLQPADSRTHVLISAGTGIAPFISMLPELVAGAPGSPPKARPRVVLAHGVSYQQELAYRTRLETLMARHPELVYAPTVSRPDAPQNAGWSGRTGRVERILPAIWAELALDPRDTIAYLCGNPDMVESSRDTLLRVGMPAGAIVHENYWAAPARSGQTRHPNRNARRKSAGRFEFLRVPSYLSCCVLRTACAAASRATGTRKGEQET
jgi:ferredoxin-NADP reductase